MENNFKQSQILEQYKLCVEMANKVSERRNQANVFFLTLNSAIISFTDFSNGIENHLEKDAKNVLLLLLLICSCYFWYRLVVSYRQLNTAKYKVIGEIEKKLPMSPYYRMEWKELGEGKDRLKYTPLTKIEQIIPIMFIIFYIVTIIYIIIL